MRRADAETGVEAWGLVLRTQAALVRALDDELVSRAGLPLSWYDVLLELRHAPAGRLRMSDLGDRVVLSRSRVSRIVDQAEAAGLVRRFPDPEDGRARLAVITPAGRAALRRAAPVYLAGIDRRFTAHIDAAEAAALVSALTRVLAAAESAGQA